jgi:transcriptional regulator with XRE-family HTH domain
VTLRLNANRLTLLRLDRGLATRQLAFDSGINIAVLNRLETEGSAQVSSLTLAQFLRLCERLGVAPDALIDDDAAPAAVESSDAAVLGAMLRDLRTAVATVVLTDVLGWTSERLHAAADALLPLLAPAGLTVHRHDGRIALRAVDDTHCAAALSARKHPRIGKSQRLVTPPRARLVHQALNYSLLSHALSDDDRRNLAVLIRAGLVQEDSERRLEVSDDVHLSLYPDGKPRPPKRPQRAARGRKQSPGPL